MNQISKEVNYDNLFDHLLGLAGHEVAHRMGANEEEANIVRDSISLIKRSGGSEYPYWAGNLASAQKYAIEEIDQTLSKTKDAKSEICGELGFIFGELDDIKVEIFNELQYQGMMAASEPQLRQTIESNNYEAMNLLGYCVDPKSPSRAIDNKFYTNGIFNIDEYYFRTTTSANGREPQMGHFRNQSLTEIQFGDYDAMRAALLTLRADVVKTKSFFTQEANFVKNEEARALKDSAAVWLVWQNIQPKATPPPSDLEKIFVVTNLEGQPILNREAVDQAFLISQSRAQKFRTEGGNPSPKTELRKLLKFVTYDHEFIRKEVGSWLDYFKDQDYRTLTEPITLRNSERMGAALSRLSEALGLATVFNENMAANSDSPIQFLIYNLDKARKEYLARTQNTSTEINPVDAGTLVINPQIKSSLREEAQKFGEKLKDRLLTHFLEVSEFEPASLATKWLDGRWSVPKSKNGTTYEVTLIHESGLSYITEKCLLYPDQIRSSDWGVVHCYSRSSTY